MLLTTSIWLCQQHSRNLGPAFIRALYKFSFPFIPRVSYANRFYESSSLFWRSSSTSDRPLSHLAFDRILHCPNPSLPSFASTRVTTLRNEPPPFDPSATHRVGPDWLDSYFARGMPDVPSSTEMLLFCQSSILMLERSTPQKWSSRRYEKADLIGELKISFECRKVETRRIGWRIEVYDPISLAVSLPVSIYLRCFPPMLVLSGPI